MAVGVVALAVAVVQDRQQIRVLAARIGALRPLARALSIADPRQVAVVKRDELWYDEHQWDVDLPPGSTYRRAIDATGTPPPSRAVPLAAGRHLVAIEQTRDRSKQWHPVVSTDGKPTIQGAEPPDWTEGTGSTGGGSVPVSQQIPVGQPAAPFRRRCTVRVGHGPSTVPTTPCAGVLLWIDVEAPPHPSRGP